VTGEGSLDEFGIPCPILFRTVFYPLLTGEGCLSEMGAPGVRPKEWLMVSPRGEGGGQSASSPWALPSDF